MTLKPVRNPNGVRLYCGPTAICAVTGRRAHVVLKAIWSRMDKCSKSQIGSWRNIKTTWPWDIYRGLRELGWRSYKAFDFEDLPTADRPSLAQWLKDPDRKMDEPYIVLIRGHWVAVKGRKFLDTHTDGQPVFLRSAPHRRAKVIAAYRVSKR